MPTSASPPLGDEFDVYKEAGVDTDEANSGLQRLVDRLRRTWPVRSGIGGVQLEIGYFANVINLGHTGLALCTDGIGSKAIIAQLMGKYDTVGIDCVAMNVNDLICVGARPLSMVDYIAVETAKADMLDAISIGLAAGAEIAGISISGGEISQIKDIITGPCPGYGFDLVGMAVGDVALDKINYGQNVEAGDIVIGIESNGIHSNGLTLARRAFFEQNNFSIDHKFADLDEPIGVELLKPTFIYVKEILEVLAAIQNVKALVHVTSDGLLNLYRVDAQVGFEIDSLPKPPPIFDLIERYGQVDKTEMFHVYNMGIGFCLVVSPDDVDTTLEILRRHRRNPTVIGRAVVDPEKRVKIDDDLVGQGKKFYRSKSHRYGGTNA
jgi:phosphoribosylformylglycinamidine cyclo-ligase